jgi:serine protease
MSLAVVALAAFGGAIAHAQEPPPIVGGQTTSDFPAVGAMVAVYGNQGGHFCSGTLVDPRWAVTAAHCIEAAEDYERSGYDVYFVLGTNMYSQSGWDEYARVSELISHPSYNSNTIAHDIGLLRLASALTSADPVPMNDDSPSGFTGDDITYVGFGVTGDDQRGGGVKRTVDVAYYGYDSMFMYTYEDGVNICSGDSGGAALIFRDGEYRLAGANSFGFDLNGGQPRCEGSGAAAGATRVDAKLSWIEGYVYGDADADADADTDTDTDADTDADTDTDTDLGGATFGTASAVEFAPATCGVTLGGAAGERSRGLAGLLGGLALIGSFIRRRRR